MKIKKLFKNRIFLCLFTALLVGSITVKATTYFPSNDVTYDNSESGLKSADVQGAIDELYMACSKPKEPVANDSPIPIVTSGDGLYKDEYEKGRYLYRGKNPKNYIRFNEETWRILSFEPDNTIKLIDTDINTKANSSTIWGEYGTDWANSDIATKTLPNNYNSILERDRNRIISHTWNVGGLSSTDSTDYLAQQIEDEKSIQWTGNIGLITVSEYLKANLDYINCGTISLNQDNYELCKEKNWLFPALTDGYYSGAWTMTQPYDTSQRTVYAITNGNHGEGYLPLPTHLKSYHKFNVMDVVYISQNTSLVGNGTQNDPYRIEGNI